MSRVTEPTMPAAQELNGWNLDSMQGAIHDLEQHPSSARLTWRSRVVWDGGFGLDIRVGEIEQQGQVMKRHFTLRGDHPQELLGQNTGPTAVESLLAALGACMAGTFAAQATARGVRIDALEVDVEGTNDLIGFFGLGPVSPALSDVRVSYRVASTANGRELQTIADAARSLSPVFNTVTRPVAVETSLRKL